MARVPITVMGYRCDRCGYEWQPRRDSTREPKVCPNPKCKSPYWDQPRRKGGAMLSYDDFKQKIATTLRKASAPLTWTEIRTEARLPQAFPNNKWVRRMEKDIGLRRDRDAHGIVKWSLA